MIWRSRHDWIDRASFSRLEQNEVLLHVVELIKKKTEAWRKDPSQARPLVVFDLDSTLFEVGPRTLSIAKEFAREELNRGKTRQDLVAWWLARTPRDIAYTLRETASAGGFPVETLEAQRYLLELEAYWRLRFFTDEYLMEDLPAPGAAAFVRRVADLGIDILYLTGRHASTMSRGTQTALKHWGFPLFPGGANLVLKPEAAFDDSEFKGQLLAAEALKSDLVAFFDNEPANFSFVWEHFPEVELVFRHASCSTKEAKLVPLVHRISDFIIN